MSPTACGKTTSLIRCKRLLRRFTKSHVGSIVFSDEKIFNVEEKLNSQNDRIYAASIEDVPEKYGRSSAFSRQTASWYGRRCQLKENSHWCSSSGASKSTKPTPARN